MELQTVMQQPGALRRVVLHLMLKYEVLDIGKRMGFNDYINFINIYKNSSPHMQGTDFTERQFFIILDLQSNSKFKDFPLLPSFILCCL